MEGDAVAGVVAEEIGAFESGQEIGGERADVPFLGKRGEARFNPVAELVLGDGELGQTSANAGVGCNVFAKR